MRIRANAERQEILDDNNIPYAIDEDFYFFFKCPKDADRAIAVLTAALAL